MICGDRTTGRGIQSCLAVLLLLAHLQLASCGSHIKTLKLSNETVHFGYFSKTLTPKLTVASGATVTVEMATHHACDDWDKMIKGDAGMESIFHWSKEIKGVQSRGATSAKTKGGYSGDGVHVLTGPIFVTDAEPGDILQVEILDLVPRKNPQGKTFGSNANAWWGFQRSVKKADGTDFLAGKFTKTPGKNDEVVTIYELTQEGGAYYAVPNYQFHWPELTDPDGVTRDFIDIPGTCVPHDFPDASADVLEMGWRKTKDIHYRMHPYKAKIPVNMHVGCMGLAPSTHDFVNSIPPMPSGGNLDDKRIGKGTTMYYPVKVKGGLLSMGDAHMAQGDSELDGTGIETSITGTFKITLHKKATFKPWQTALDFPLGEMTSPPAWVVHGYTKTDYLADYSSNPGEICTAAGDSMRDSSSTTIAAGALKRIDDAMTNTFAQTRKFIMAMYNITDAEATTIITQGVDFGLTQLVDCNFGVHAVILKSLFQPSTTMAAFDYSKAPAPAPKVLKLSNETVHFGYFSKSLKPQLTVASGDTVTVEMATHHACDDWDKMIKGDAGMESIFTWSKTIKGVQSRGATSAKTKGKYSGDGVHVLTGPIFVTGAEPGDILQVEVVDLQPRKNPNGETYGSNANAWWGYQKNAKKPDGSAYKYGKFTSTPGENDEVVTIYKLYTEGGQAYATPDYMFEWTTLTDPDGVERDFIDIPGTCVPHDYSGVSDDVKNMGWTKPAPIKYTMNPFKAKIPVNMHIGCMGLAPESHEYVNSIPPMPSGGNLDDKRIGKGTTMYYPVEVAGGLLSMGDAHMAQGDSELDGTGIETSITGTFKITLHKKGSFSPWQTALDFPLGETASHWIVHGFSRTDYLETFKNDVNGIFALPTPVGDAMTNAFTQTRKFLMKMYNLTDPEATTIITQGVDFGITQVVDGNFGVHAVIPKSIFAAGVSDGKGTKVEKFAKAGATTGPTPRPTPRPTTASGSAATPAPTPTKAAGGDSVSFAASIMPSLMLGACLSVLLRAIHM